MNARKAQKALREHAIASNARFMARFFKTGAGQYGEGDRFIGVSVPNTRLVAKRFALLSIKEIQKLLRSPIHEDRLLALVILNGQFKSQKEEAARRALYHFYLSHRERINNWDLVDVSAPHIVGAYLLRHPRDVLYRLVRSKVLWDRRIAIISTHAFIRKGDLRDAFKLSERLLADEEDLMHKAVGWTLREAGKKDPRKLMAFLRQHAPRMPRTALRYAIERLPEATRKRILKSSKANG